MTKQLIKHEDNSYSFVYTIGPVCIGLKSYAKQPVFSSCNFEITIKAVGSTTHDRVLEMLAVDGVPLDAFISNFNGAIFIGPDSMQDMTKFESLYDEFNIYTIKNFSIEYVASIIHAQLSALIQEHEQLEYCRVGIIINK